VPAQTQEILFVDSIYVSGLVHSEKCIYLYNKDINVDLSFFL